MWEFGPGEASPYHWHAGEEEWLVVLRGTVTLRTPDGERRLGAWDVAVFVRGPDGAHQIRNDGTEPACVVFFATRNDPDVRVYPDDDAVTVVSGGKVIVRR